MAAFAVIFYALCLVKATLAGVELLKNHDMEIVNVNKDWTCQGGCTLTSSTDHHSGYHSVKVSNRHHDWDGLSQNVQVTAGSVYRFSSYVKVLNLAPGTMYQSVAAKLSCTLPNGRKLYLSLCQDIYVELDKWTEIGGIHAIQDGAHNCHLYYQLKGASVNYLVDGTSLQLVPTDTHWRTEAEARIEQIRKADISVSLTGTSNALYDVEIIQTKHEFGFGSAVAARELVDPHYSQYAQTFYDNFEWAVLENALKWKQMERTKGHIDYDRPLNAIHALRANGTKVRGHNVFWGGERHIQNWVLSTSKQDLPHLIQERVNGVIGHTKNLLEHWDVNNENLHGDWYERHTGNPNITMDMFRYVHAVDPNVKLFLNDFGVLESYTAVPLAHQAKRFKDSGVPIYGVGIQSHLHDINFDPSEYKLILDIVAQAGLPIWITELSIKSTDEQVKARALEDILTLYFSHPSVEGVLFWGFWDGKLFDRDTALFEGPNVTPNAAGRAYQTLFKTTWRTHVTKSLHGDASFSVRGFKGTYTIKIKQNGKVINSETFTLGDNGQSLQINAGSNSPGIIVG